ncbi:MAG TPA: hypothetical protein VNJ02_13570 [Vicinamibacterales bacterium]|nr:hypothetical protein [Vicinamibacterales bacterium]
MAIRTFIRTTFNVVALGAFLGAPVAAASLWFLLTDPTLAGAVAEDRAFFPVARTLLFAMGKVIATVLAYL